MADDEGATPRELLLESARRNNTDLAEEVLAGLQAKAASSEAAEDAIADLINNARDGMGHTALHLAAKYGSYEVLDTLLDQPGVETDPVVPSSFSTPLHLAVIHSNEAGRDDWPAALALVDMLLDAGCDPRLRDRSRRKPVELVDARNEELKTALRRAEVRVVEGGDVVNEDEEDEGGSGPPTDDEI